MRTPIIWLGFIILLGVGEWSTTFEENFFKLVFGGIIWFCMYLDYQEVMKDKK